ncbi:hypothetical protein Bbelb_406920 [Branchiostoma belcheri]|nr:hypothetical protein Bbelb_406920 [Branchiostoma belcheri]
MLVGQNELHAGGVACLYSRTSLPAEASFQMRLHAPCKRDLTFELEEPCTPAAYVQRVREERDRLVGQCQEAEGYLNYWNLPAHVLEQVRMADHKSPPTQTRNEVHKTKNNNYERSQNIINRSQEV